MVRDIPSCPAGTGRTLVQVMAARVGADVLAQYQKLASRLRQKGSNAAAAMARTADPDVRAAHRCASELYETAASELDNLVADLFDSSERPPQEVLRRPVLRVLDGGRPKTDLEQINA